MSRFKSYIHEGVMKGKTRSVSLDEKKAAFMLNRKCSKALEGWDKYGYKGRIYRGLEGKSGYFVTDPTMGQPRISANTENYLTIFMDNLPSWSKYPKRSRSVVCSTNPGYAKNYGNVFVVFPEDTCKIGVCSGIDIWWSFNVMSDVNDWNSSIVKALGMFNRDHLKAQKDYKYLIDSLDNIRKEIEGKEDEYYDSLFEFISFWKHVFDKGDNWLNSLNKILSPKNNEFKLTSPGERYPSDNEVWVGHGKCLMVEWEKAQKIVDIAREIPTKKGGVFKL